MLRRAVKRSHETGAAKTKRHKDEKKQGKIQGVLGEKPKKDEADKTLERLVMGDTGELMERLQSVESPKSKSFIKDESDIKSEEDNLADEDDADKAPAPVWQDDDDDEKIGFRVSSTAQYPTWAKMSWEREGQDEERDELLTSTRTYLVDSPTLTKGLIQMKKCTDANAECPSKCKLRSVEFHPNAQVLLAAGTNQTVNLFQIDGKQNAKIQSVFVEKFPIFSAHFTTDGHQVIMGSKHRSFYYYDMMGGRVVNVPVIKGLEETSMKDFSLSPDGKFIVFHGSYGRMHLISAQSKEWISTLSMNGSVAAIDFTSDGQTMYSIGNDGEVYVWDLNTRSCVHRFVDDGCIDGTSIAVSKNNQYLATGSYSGVVNIYNRNNLSDKRPTPLKSIMNLTTPCTKALFNSTTEILALSSNYTESAVKFVHLPSMTVFSNFPGKEDKLNTVSSLDFSLNSGYVCMGTDRGQALLYRLQHYANY